LAEAAKDRAANYLPPGVRICGRDALRADGPRELRLSTHPTDLQRRLDRPIPQQKVRGRP